MNKESELAEDLLDRIFALSNINLNLKDVIFSPLYQVNALRIVLQSYIMFLDHKAEEFEHEYPNQKNAYLISKKGLIEILNSFGIREYIEEDTIGHSPLFP